MQRIAIVIKKKREREKNLRKKREKLMENKGAREIICNFKKVIFLCVYEQKKGIQIYDDVLYNTDK